MSEFKQAYTKLNAKQREAVDTIEGALLVLAGPGTGKTQLLSTRVANILNKTDANPRNILCLTYTDAGANEMRDRLVKTIGVDGYQVSVHTFHGFALEVFRRFDNYFADRPKLEPIDELRRYELLKDVQMELPMSFALRHKTFSGERESIEDLSKRVAELKNSGLSPDQAKTLADQNAAAMDKLSGILDVLPSEFSNKKVDKIARIEDVANFLTTTAKDFNLDETEADRPSGERSTAFKNLGDILVGSLARAVAECDLEDADAKAITAWKDQNLEKDARGKWIFTDRATNRNLYELTEVYRLYQKKLDENGLLEFDDMIFDLLDAMRNQKALRYNMQEQWQYVLVDEFQDTNPAQLGIISLLGQRDDGATPNIMAVGDDDQAIYAFQGADVTNIKNFIELWPDVKIITLEDNYRSSENILNVSKVTAQMIDDRPVGTEVKILKSMSGEPGAIENKKARVQILNTNESELEWVVDDIKKKIIDNVVAVEDIAVLAPTHKFLIELADSLYANEIAVSYEKNSNILDDEIILSLVKLAELVLAIAQGDSGATAGLLPEVLNDPYWGLKVDDVWKLSVATKNMNYKAEKGDRKHWLDVMEGGEILGEQGISIHKQLMYWAKNSLNLSLEHMLDMIIGVSSKEKIVKKLPVDAPETSPFKNYYFDQNPLEDNPAEYANFLSSLSTLREGLRSYFVDRSQSKLVDLVKYVRIAKDYGGLKIKRSGMHIQSRGVNLMTAHSSKGLEFEHVYLLHCQDNVWSENAPGKSMGLQLTSNFGKRKDSPDDKTRLFYVAQTRAKYELTMSAFKFKDNGTESVLARYIEPLLSDSSAEVSDNSGEVLEAKSAAKSYQHKIFGAGLNALYGTEFKGNKIDKAETLALILKPILEDYKLSVTHMNTLLDKIYGGPIEFINRYLLRFPSATGESAAHGTAAHEALELAFYDRNKLTDVSSFVKFVNDAYEAKIITSDLDYATIEASIEKAGHMFEKFGDELYESIQSMEKAELDLRGNFDEARLSGKIDGLILNESEDGLKTATVIDYKTGKTKGRSSPEYKQYKYQLYFYRLLLELNPEILPKDCRVTTGEIVYLHPSLPKIEKLSLDYSNVANEKEYLKFKTLVKKVWAEIMELGGIVS